MLIKLKKIIPCLFLNYRNKYFHNITYAQKRISKNLEKQAFYSAKIGTERWEAELIACHGKLSGFESRHSSKS
jgi:hypothetical protein